MSKPTTKEIQAALLDAAQQARENSYSPYSHFKVGAAVLGEDGKMYTGTNIENSSYGLTVCAERNAIFKAVGEGQRNLLALAVCTDPIEGEDFGSPCGACRQVMTEFMDIEAPLLLVSAQKDGGHKILEKKLKDFMPYPFPRLCDK